MNCRVYFSKKKICAENHGGYLFSIVYASQSIVKHALLRLIGNGAPATQPTLGATLHLNLAV